MKYQVALINEGYSVFVPGFEIKRQGKHIIMTDGVRIIKKERVPCNEI